MVTRLSLFSSLLQSKSELGGWSVYLKLRYVLGDCPFFQELSAVRGLTSKAPCSLRMVSERSFGVSFLCLSNIAGP